MASPNSDSDLNAAVVTDPPKPIDLAQAEPGGWSSSTNLWRGLTSMSVGVAAVALMVAFKLNSSHAKLGQELEELSARMNATPEIQFVAVLSDDKAAASMLATFDPKSRQLMIKRVGGVMAPTDKSLQLWALPHTGRPTSLGLLGTDAVTRLPATASDVNVPALAISLEPKGGAPSGAGPTGPVLFKGAVIETSL